MNLIVTSPQRLREVYGPQGAGQVLGMVARLLRARARRGITTRLLSIDDGLPGLAVPGAPAEPDSIAEQLAAVADVLELGGRQLASVLIVGGPEIVPFAAVANPTPTDGDTEIRSDRRYSSRDAGALLPEWAVGRLPGAASTDPGLLVRLLRQAMLLHEEPPAGPALPFGYSAAIWSRAATLVYGELSDQPPLLSPPLVATTLDPAQVGQARHIYCNLHGVRDGPIWYGQAADRRGLVVALRPSDLDRLNLRGAVVMSEACYGASIAGRDERSSLALAFLGHGAAGFVGATAITYGPVGPPLGEADLIALHFLRALKTPSITLGAAFSSALAGMLADTLARQPALDDDDLKTALAFVLYGDPTLTVGDATPEE